MKKTLLIPVLILVSIISHSQFIHKIKADSVLITNDSCTAELNLENSTKNVNGFLYNKGNGRTEFRKGVIKINDSIYIIGSDTLNLSNFTSGNSWKITGNSNINPENNFLGTVDSNKLIFRTNNLQRGSIWENGTFNIAPNDTTTNPLFRVYPNGDLTIKSRNSLTGNVFGPNNGIRYNTKYGIFEIGTNNNFDTALAVSCCGSQVKSALIINSDFLNTFRGHVHGSAVGGDNILVDTFATVAWSTVFGEGHRIKGAKGMVNKSTVSGYGMQITEQLYGTFISGNANSVAKPMYYGLINGLLNSAMDSSSGSTVNGFVNKYGGAGQVVLGGGLVNRTPYGTALGVKNVDFTTLPYTGDRGYYNLSAINNIRQYPLFMLGNSSTGHNGSIRSNALTVLYNGRSQINTTGFNTNLTENDVTPKAALEIVSNNSGILIPRLTSTQQNNILSSDLHNGLLLYNTDSSNFQFYNGSIWKSLNGGSSGSSYTLPIASPAVLGGIKVGANLSIDAGGVLSASNGGGMAIGGAITGSPNEKSLLFVGAGGVLAQNTNLIFDGTNKYLGINMGSVAPSDFLQVGGTTGSIQFGGANGRTMTARNAANDGYSNFDFIANSVSFDSRVEVLSVGGASGQVQLYEGTAGAATDGALEHITDNLNFTSGTTRYIIPKTLVASATLDFPNTTSNSVADLTITVTGAALGDAVSLGIPNASVTPTATFSAWVSAANTVKIRFSPKATENPASGTFKVSVIK